MKSKFNRVLKVLMVLLLSISLFSCKKNDTAVTPLEGEIKETYRTVAIATINGTATVTRSDGEKVTAYEGMALYNGDDIVVDKDSSVIIDADSDKHLLAEAGTHFWLTIEGTEEQSNTKINLDTGAVLCQIEEKLEDGESFDVVTASSTMCVRGTVFRVNSLETEENKFDVVEVYNGKVWSNINDSDEEVTLDPGQSAMIQTPNDTSEASYVSSNQVDYDEWNKGNYDKAISENKGDGNPVLDINYQNLPKEAIDQLLNISDGNQELSVSKDDLEALKNETNNKQKVSNNNPEASNSELEISIEAKPIVDETANSSNNAPEYQEPVYEAPTESGTVAGQGPNLEHPGGEIPDGSVINTNGPEEVPDGLFNDEPEPQSKTDVCSLILKNDPSAFDEWSACMNS